MALPEGEHYAILLATSVPDGWEGMRPATEYHAFANRSDWEAEIDRLMRQPFSKSFRALIVRTAIITTAVKVG